MRDELHLMELVDRYLDGSMNAEERGAFEARAGKSQELRELIEDQRALREGVARVPVRAAAAKAFRAYRFGKPGPWIGGAVVVAIIAASALLTWNTVGDTEGSSGQQHGSDAGIVRVLSDTTGIQLDPFVVTIDPMRDSTLITPNGIVLDIPHGAFLDSLGHAITAPVRVTLLEALEPLDIVKAGLSTMSGDTLLETGGMFYFDAQANGRPVRIDPSQAITAMVPANSPQKDMMLYQGVKQPDGRIDWRDPKPLKKSLVPVDITTLNFYPPGYEAKLAEMGQDVGRRVFRDSLYWSFSGAMERQWLMGPSQNNVLTIERIDAIADSAYSTYDSSNSDTYRNVGVDPAKVKAIWNERFNNTNLATREFEERMRAIHGTCDQAALDAYVNNLDRDLSEIDRQVGAMGHAEFDHFAERNDGRVDLPKHAADRLRRVYEHWSRAEAEAIRTTQEKFWREQERLDARSDQHRTRHDAAERQRSFELFQQEYELNLAEACKQLGIKKLGPRREPPITAYVANITNPGWWNVDRAVFQATADRKSMEFTDKTTGKKATLKYAELKVQVSDRTAYDELVVYLLPAQLNSFQRMKEADGAFTERLNDLLTYELFCLGMKGKQQFAYKTSVNGTSSISASLSSVDENDLRRMLRTKGQVEQDLLEEARYMEWSVLDKRRQRANSDRIALRSALLPIVFPCGDVPSEVPSEAAIRRSRTEVPSTPVAEKP